MSKVFYISANGFIGGAEKVLLHLAKMHKENEESASFLLFNDGILKDELSKLGFPVFVLKNKFKLTSPIKLLRAIIEIRKILNENDFNIIHSTMAYAHLVMGISSLFMKKKRIWFQHGPVGGILDFLASFFSVDIILFNSDFLLEKHMNAFSLHKGRFAAKIIPLPVMLEEPNYAEILNTLKKLELTNKFIIGSFGRIARGKNYDLLINSFAKLDMDDARLVIMGSPASKQDELYHHELKELCSKLGVRDRVLFLNHQSDVSTYYKSLNLYVHAGVLDEGFGLTVAEAMYLGVPVVSSDYGALKDFVLHQETAYVVNTREISAVDNLKEMIVRERSNDVESKRISKVAQETIKLKYGYSNFQVAIVDVYQFLNSID